MSDPLVDVSGSFDVAIAGAGLAGGSLALSLARAGARVALLDPASFPREKLCGEFLSPECWGVFERLGLTAGIEALGYHPIERVRITTPRGRVLESDFTGPDGLPGIGLSRGALDHLIVQSARSAGVVVLEKSRVKGPLVRDGKVVGILARQGAAEPFEVPATITIAADGRHSALVKQTGQVRARSRFRPALFGLKHHVHIPDRLSEPIGTVGLHLLHGGYVGACRVETSVTNLCGLLPESILKRHRGDLDRLARDVFPANPVLDRLWQSGTPLGDWKTISDVRVQASTPSLPGILYAGDAQGTIDPLGGQGMTMALLGAAMLAPMVTHALSKNGADADLQRLFKTAWHRRFDQRIRLCRVFHHILINPRLVDAASIFSNLAPRLLALGFNQTRDSVPV